MTYQQNVILTLFWWRLLHGDLIAKVRPANLDIGLTTTLQVECLFTRDKSSSLTFLMSLTLSHSESTTEPDFVDLVSINNFDSQLQGNVQDDPNTQVYGAIDNKNASFLGIKLEYPKVDCAGAYRCEAHGINQMGKPVSQFSNATVSGIYPDTKQIVEQLQKLTKQMEQLQTNNNKLEKDNKQLAKLVIQIQTDTNSTTKQLTDLVQMKNSDTVRYLKAQNVLFKSSPVFNGSRYLLSKTYGNTNYLFSIFTCGLLGGYLAEIDSAEEYNFVRDNLLQGTSYSFVYVSGTDVAAEGVWIHSYSQTPVKYFNWYPNEPNKGRQENCMAYYGPPRWQSLDVSCDLLPSFDGTVAFICEVPE